MSRKATILLLVFIVLDTAFSFIQHLHFPHDGDMAVLIIPSDRYQPVLDDPFGFKLLFEDNKYGGPNRFFAQWSLGAYFKTAPLLLQGLVTPIQSTYLATALAKIAIQFCLLWTLAAYITGTWSLKNRYAILSLALLAPLFQTFGINWNMGVIGQSITYTFFYALPMAVLLLFFYPFYSAYVLRKGFSKNPIVHILLVAAVVIIPFHGPLSSAVIMIVCSSTLFYFWYKGLKELQAKPLVTRFVAAIGKIPLPVLGYFVAIILISVYSFCIGTFNDENSANIPITDRYKILPYGVAYQLFDKPGLPMLLILIGVNAWLLKKQNLPESKWLLRILIWLSIFSVVYILLLPLGGYRTYRPYIVRGDTFLPVTFCIFFYFGLSTVFLIRNFVYRQYKFYLPALLVVLAYFTVVDHETYSHVYMNEKAALKQIAASPDNPVQLYTNTPVIAWEPIRDPNQTEYQAKLLKIWRITPDERRYYHKLD